MSALEMQIMNNLSALPDMYQQTVLDLILGLKRTIAHEKAAKNHDSPICRIGSRKGVQFFANGHDLDEHNDEIAEMFGVNK